jgi:hypothetical protein
MDLRKKAVNGAKKIKLKFLVRNISILKKKPLVNGIKKYVKKKGLKLKNILKTLLFFKVEN